MESIAATFPDTYLRAPRAWWLRITRKIVGGKLNLCLTGPRNDASLPLLLLVRFSVYVEKNLKDRIMTLRLVLKGIL